MSEPKPESGIGVDVATPIMRVVSISKRYGGVHAVQDVSLELFAGEVCALVGGNGAGKSTVVSMLSGVFPPDRGQILLEERPRYFSDPQDARAAGIETVFQALALIDTLDAAENIYLGREELREPRSLRWLDEKGMRCAGPSTSWRSWALNTPLVRLFDGCPADSGKQSPSHVLCSSRRRLSS